MKKIINIEELSTEQNNALNDYIFNILPAIDDISEMGIEKFESTMQFYVNICYKLNNINLEISDIRIKQTEIDLKLDKLNDVVKKLHQVIGKIKTKNICLREIAFIPMYLKQKKIYMEFKNIKKENDLIFQRVKHLQGMKDECINEYEQWKSCFNS